MPDENLNTEVTTPVTTPDPQVPQYTEVELKAMEQGWRPKEEFSGDEHEFIDAAEFVRRQPLFDKIEHMGKELKETKKVLNSLQEHHKKVKETEYKRALEELKTAKKQALEDGDADKLLAVDDAIAEVRTAQLQAQQVVSQPQVDPRFTAWTEKNKWYISNTEMREFADAVGLQHAQRNPEKAPEEVLEYVVNQVKRAYADKFTNPKRTQPTAVEGGDPGTSNKGSKTDSFELTEEERRVMNSFVRANVMTKEEYITELKKVRG